MAVSGLSYVRLAKGRIATSLQLADDVIADYDVAGAVIGIEFLSESAAARESEFVTMANSAERRIELQSNG